MAQPWHKWAYAGMLLAGVLATCAGARLRAEEPAIDGVLVLHNGNVLAGSIGRHGDEYQIRQGNSTLRVPSEQVERFAASLGEVYEARRAAIVGATPEAHLALADWCLRVNLLNEAARELLDVRTLDAGHPALADAELRLRQLLAQESASGVPEEVCAESVPNEAALDSPAPPLAISPEAQVQFVRNIQPMLINNCTSGGCHHVDSERLLQLDRWALRGNGDADVVRRNLTAVLRQVNPRAPAASPLVEYGRRPHGDAAAGRPHALTARQATLLVGWLNVATGMVAAETSPEPQWIEPGDAATASATYSPDVYPTDDILNGMSLEELQLAAQAAAEEDTATEPMETRFMPRDAFDAEIFNRRRKSKPISTGASGSDPQADSAEADATSGDELDAELPPPEP
jgi:hypothetical protein